MDKLKLLELKKLFKELDYIQSDYDYKQEIISSSESIFLNEVSDFLSKNQSLKDIYDKKIQNNIDKFIKSQQDRELNEIEFESDIEVIEEENIDLEKDNKIKNVYRSIAKLTHPDKIVEKKLNDFYVKATEFYNSNDIIGLYSICLNLDIDIDYSSLDIIDLQDKISKLKDRVNFMESTLTWKWHFSKNNLERSSVIMSFIKTQLFR